MARGPRVPEDGEAGIAGSCRAASIAAHPARLTPALFADRKIVEHWDVSQDVPEKAANGNTMF